MKEKQLNWGFKQKDEDCKTNVLILGPPTFEPFKPMQLHIKPTNTYVAHFVGRANTLDSHLRDFMFTVW